jgi:hypothetical protein
MGFTAAAILGSAVVGGAVASRGASKAARAQQQAADQAAQLQRETFERQAELAEPFRQAGITSQNELLRMLGLGGEPGTPGYGSLGQQFTAEQMYQDPGYMFRLAEGEKALQRMQSARGGGIGKDSGRAIREGVRYGQDYASAEYQNAFNRAQALLGNRLGALGSLYGAGQTGTQQVIGAAGQYGSNVGNLLMQGGQARASGYLGQANALSNALGQAAMGYGLSRGGYFGPTGVSSPASNNLMAFNYQGPQYGNMG